MPEKKEKQPDLEVDLPLEKVTPGTFKFGAKKVVKDQDLSFYFPKELTDEKGQPKGIKLVATLLW